MQETRKTRSKFRPSDLLNGMLMAIPFPALLTWAYQNYAMSGAQVGEALKAADFSNFDPGRWEDMVEAVVMARNGA
jgi:hypothetical protein